MVDFIQVPPSLSNGQDRYVLDAFVTVTGGTLDFKPGMSLQLKYGAVPGYLNSLLGSGNVGSTISTQYGQGTVAPTPEPASVSCWEQGSYWPAGFCELVSAAPFRMDEISAGRGALPRQVRACHEPLSVCFPLLGAPSGHGLENASSNNCPKICTMLSRRSPTSSWGKYYKPRLRTPMIADPWGRGFVNVAEAKGEDGTLPSRRGCRG